MTASAESPNPGSPEAVALGCRCATMDNANGRGYRYVEGRPVHFVVTDDCRLHGWVGKSREESKP